MVCRHVPKILWDRILDSPLKSRGAILPRNDELDFVSGAFDGLGSRVIGLQTDQYGFVFPENLTI